GGLQFVRLHEAASAEIQPPSDAQSAHQSRRPSTSSRGFSPRLGAPKTRISRPSGPASYPRHVPGGTRTTSHFLTSTISSSSFIRPLPPTTTNNSSCSLCVWPYGNR